MEKGTKTDLEGDSSQRVSSATERASSVGSGSSSEGAEGQSILNRRPSTRLSASLTPLEERRLKRARGQKIVELVNNHPVLQDTASENPSTLKERTRIWGRIVDQINRTYGKQLGRCSVERVKKLFLYYKKREGSSKMTTEEMIEDIEEESETVEDNHPPIKMEMDVDDSLKSALDAQPLPGGMPSGTMPSLSSPSPSADAMNTNQSGGEALSTLFARATANRASNLRRERADFVFDLVTFYQERMCFRDKENPMDDRAIRYGRSSSVNAERMQMWLKVMERTNEKFAISLGEVDVEQIKKMYTNRLSRPKKSTEPTITQADVCMSLLGEQPLLALPAPPVSLSAPSTFSATLSTSVSSKKKKTLHTQVASSSLFDLASSAAAVPLLAANPKDEAVLMATATATPLRGGRDLTLHFSPAQSSSNGVAPRDDRVGKLDTLLRSIDRSDEINNLHEQLEEKDREIDRLRKKVVEQAEDYRRRFRVMMEVVMTGVNEQTALDIASALRSSSANGAA